MPPLTPVRLTRGTADSMFGMDLNSLGTSLVKAKHKADPLPTLGHRGKAQAASSCLSLQH